MAKLNQVIATEKTLKTRAHELGTKIYHLVQKPDLFNGLYKTYVRKNEDGDDLPPEKKHVQFKVRDLLDEVKKAYIHLMDLTIQKDRGNGIAISDLYVDEELIFPNVPVTTLLFLEKQLTDHRSLISALPVLDIADEWEADKNESNFFRAAPTSAYRTKKVQKPLVLLEPTKEHPGSAVVITDDVIVGFWNTEKVSGAIPKKDKDRMLEKVDKLLLAVKEAREKANDTDAGKRPALGAAIYAYLEG